MLTSSLNLSRQTRRPAKHSCNSAGHTSLSLLECAPLPRAKRGLCAPNGFAEPRGTCTEHSRPKHAPATPLECAPLPRVKPRGTCTEHSRPNHAAVTPLESALRCMVSSNSFRFRSYKNMGGGGYLSPIEESYE